MLFYYLERTQSSVKGLKQLQNEVYESLQQSPNKLQGKIFSALFGIIKNKYYWVILK